MSSCIRSSSRPARSRTSGPDPSPSPAKPERGAIPDGVAVPAPLHGSGAGLRWGLAPARQRSHAAYVGEAVLLGQLVDVERLAGLLGDVRIGGERDDGAADVARRLRVLEVSVGAPDLG